MSYPEYKVLNEKERADFTEAWQEKMTQSRFYPWLYRHIRASISGFKLYFFICFMCLIIFSFKSLYFSIIGIFGFLSAQVLFAIFHTRVHALFLEYDEWNIHSKARVMLTPIVSFYAFYHHHHTRNDNWLPKLSYYDDKANPDGTNYVVLAHWYSFSFFNVVLQLPFAIVFVLAAFYFAPFYSLAAFIGYEIGQFFIPVFHGYGHNVAHQILGTHHKTKRNPIARIIDGANGLLFYIMKKCRLLATPREHAVHHLNYDKTPFVYRSFSSSGIYSSYLDKWLDKYYVWGFRQLPKRAYDVMRFSALGIVMTFFLLPFVLALILHH
jgi:hypothetical protein